MDDKVNNLLYKMFYFRDPRSTAWGTIEPLTGVGVAFDDIERFSQQLLDICPEWEDIPWSVVRWQVVKLCEDISNEPSPTAQAALWMYDPTDAVPQYVVDSKYGEVVEQVASAAKSGVFDKEAINEIIPLMSGFDIGQKRLVLRFIVKKYGNEWDNSEMAFSNISKFFQEEFIHYTTKRKLEAVN